MSKMTPVQKAALDLILDDVQFFYTYVECDTGVHFELDNRYHDRKFRNCLAHYGLGQYLTADDIMDDDPLKGLTHRAFGEAYENTKTGVFEALRHLSRQIEERVLKVQAYHLRLFSYPYR